MYVLTIGGSDPSSGAGIQRDLQTFDALDTYGLGVITTVTSQNTSRFFGAQSVSARTISSQIRSVISDFKIDVIKIGMVFDKNAIHAIYSELRDFKIPIILDPVFESTTKGILLRKDAFMDFKKLLIPLAHIITPNISEAERLSNLKIKNMDDIRIAAKKIRKLGVENIIIKGGHMPNRNKITDVLLVGKQFHIFEHQYVKTESHGGGCTFSAALCVGIAMGKKIPDAVKYASKFTTLSIKNAKKVGKGLLVVQKINNDEISSDLIQGIKLLSEIPNIYQYIPEVQTNFVYCNPKPKTLKDILGLEGRIVRAGTTIIPAGNLKYGGSKHVGAALLEISKKFPLVRSALNIKFDDNTIIKAKRKGLVVSSYDRVKEPILIKKKEGSTISWGISEAIRTSGSPDIIFHRGDIGKEPMILIFGKTPKDILKKLSKIV